MEAAQQLVIRGASVGAQDAKGNTPLHLACGLAGTDVVRLLLAHGSPLNALNDRRRHPLHLACRGGHLEVAITLLEYGADPSAKDAHGKQAVDMIGAGRRIPQGLRVDIINTLERYQMGEYAIARAPLSSTRSLRQMWKDRDSAGESTPRASTARTAGSLPSSAGGGAAGQGGGAAAAAAAAGAAAAAAAAAGSVFDERAGGSTIYSSRGGSMSRKGSMSLDGFSTASMGTGGEGVGPLSGRGAAMRHSSRGFSEGDGRGDGGGGGGGRSPRWTVGAAVAGRLEGMRARELGASLRAKVQENEAMKRYVESVTEEMRALQQKISQQSSPASPPPPLPPPLPPILSSYAGGGLGAGSAAALPARGPGEGQLSIAEMVARGIGAARQDPGAHSGGAGAGAGGESLFDGRRNSNPSLLRGATALGAGGGVGTEAAAVVPHAHEGVIRVEGGSAVAEERATTTQPAAAGAGDDAGAVAVAAVAGLKGGEVSSVTATAAPAAPAQGSAQREV
ncbi:unnamed protein product, partial [Ectocarpus fasciculatus]